MLDFDRLNDNWKMYEGNPLEDDVEEERTPFNPYEDL